MSTKVHHVDYLNRDEVIARLNGEFSVFDPAYVDVKRTMARELSVLSDGMLRTQKERGNPLCRSEQILNEATWLLHYTANWNRLHRRIHELRLSLADGEAETPDQTGPVQGGDGGFGAGTTEFFSKLDATTDAVQRKTYRPHIPLRFMAPVLRPGRLPAYLHRLLVSEIRAAGLNRRGELASVESSLLQFFCKAPMRELLLDPRLWPGLSAEQVSLTVQELDETFGDFIDQSQHPRTGFWSPWYVLDGELIKMHDLSFTFHIVNFRKRRVDRWPEIVAILLRIRDLDLQYPYNWRPSDSPSPFCNHHNTDVARILQAGYGQVGERLRRRIADAMLAMLDWCLTSSLKA